MLDRYLRRNDYNVYKDYEYMFKQKLLKQYKYQHLLAAGAIDQQAYDTALNPRDYLAAEKDVNGIDIAHDVMDSYKISIEDEKLEIAKKAKNIDYLRTVNETYEYCRSRCKIQDQRLKNLAYFPGEYQKCFGDCLNIRTELFNNRKPNNEKNKKTFVWIA